MKEKFDIQYRITKRDREEIKKIKKVKQFFDDIGPQGDISITLGDYVTSQIFDIDEVSNWDILDVWFRNFKNVYENLADGKQIVINDIDEPRSFFRFMRGDGKILIQHYDRKYPVYNGRYCFNADLYEIECLGETIVQENSFFEIIKRSVNSYWTEIAELNPILSEYVEQFKIK